MDVSWMPAGEDLPWAQESWDAVVAFARDIWALVAPFIPTLLYLDDRLKGSLARVARRSGADWVAGQSAYLR